MPRGRTSLRLRSSRLAASVAVLLLCAVALGSAPSGAAADSARSADSAPPRAVADSTDTAGSPTLPVMTPTYAYVQGTVGIGATTLATRPKLVIKIPSVLSVLYYLPASRYLLPLPVVPGKRPPKVPVPVPAPFQSDVPGCVFMTDASVHASADTYAVSTAPGGKPIGAFPPTPVTMLAFGAIPVKATVQLSQVVDGALKPIEIDQWIGLDGTGPACDPTLGSRNPHGWTSAHGQLSMTLSGVTVDGQPLDVGAHCETQSPLALNLWANYDPNLPNGGYAPGVGGTLYQRANDARVDVPGGRLLDPGSTDLTIPAFTGCVSAAGDDVSRLVTAMVSGPGNQLVAHQNQPEIGAGSTGLGHYDPNDPTACEVGSDGTKYCTWPAPAPDISVPSK